MWPWQQQVMAVCESFCKKKQPDYYRSISSETHKCTKHEPRPETSWLKIHLFSFFSFGLEVKASPPPCPKPEARLSTHVLVSNPHDAWPRLKECLVFVCFFSIKDNLQVSSQVVSMTVGSGVAPRWISNQTMTLSLETVDVLKAAEGSLRPPIPWGLCTLRQSAASSSHRGSSYCCWQLIPVPRAGEIR